MEKYVPHRLHFFLIHRQGYRYYPLEYSDMPHCSCCRLRQFFRSLDFQWHIFCQIPEAGLKVRISIRFRLQ